MVPQQVMTVMAARPGPVIVIDSDGVVQLINDEACALLRRSETNVVGDYVEQLIPESVRWAHARYRLGFVTEPSERDMAWGMEPHAIAGDGSMVPVEVHLTPVQTDHDIYVVASLTERT